MGLLLSRKNVGFFPDNFVEKEAQRQNVGFCLEGQKQNSFFTKIVATENRTRDPHFYL